jgi:phosphoglycerate kinase
MAATSIPPALPGQTRKRNVFDVLEALPADKHNVLIRVDFNVPMNDQKEITDDSRIRGALPTILAVLQRHRNAILVSHLGRPSLVQKGGDDDATRAERDQLSLKPIAAYLAKLIDRPVIFGEDCIGEAATEAIAQLPESGGGVVLLENLRFYKDEEKNKEDFAKYVVIVVVMWRFLWLR